MNNLAYNSTRYEGSQVKVVAIKEEYGMNLPTQVCILSCENVEKGFPQVRKKDQTEDSSTKMVHEDPVKHRGNH